MRPQNRRAQLHNEIHSDRALKGAMKAADKSGSRYSLVIGDEEITSGLVEVKEMSSGTATSVRLDSLASALK